MKIALIIVHDYPVGGTTAWAQYMVQGLKANGADVTVIKHKRQRTAISAEDIIITDADEARRAMAGCDFAIFQGLVDTAAFKKQKTWWVELAEHCPIPWAICSHDDAASGVVRNAFFGNLMAGNNFSKKIFSFSYLPPDRLPDDVTQIPMVLPFDPAQIDWHAPPTSARAAIVFLGQIMRQKNWPLFARMAELWSPDEPREFVMVGRAASSPGVSLTSQLAQRLIANGAVDPAERDLAHWSGDLHKPRPWMLNLANGSTLRYAGGYEYGQAVAWARYARVMVNMTSRKLGSVGPTEYVVLEAAAGGAQPVQSAHNGKMDSYLGIETFDYNFHSYVMGPKVLAGKHDDIVASLTAAVQRAYSADDRTQIDRAMQLSINHDPARVAKWMLDAIG